MPKNKNYINETEFCDFKENFKLMVQTLNHNITEMKDDAKVTKEQIINMAVDLGEIKGKLKITSKIVWWILGIIAVIVGAAVLATL